jgi:hypothetical protein
MLASRGPLGLRLLSLRILSLSLFHPAFGSHRAARCLPLLCGALFPPGLTRRLPHLPLFDSTLLRPGLPM